MTTKQGLQFAVDKIENLFDVLEILNFPTNAIEEAFGESKALEDLVDARDVLKFMITEIEYTEEKDRIEKLVTGGRQ
jgi:hypothetical protein